MKMRSVLFYLLLYHYFSVTCLFYVLSIFNRCLLCVNALSGLLLNFIVLGAITIKECNCIVLYSILLHPKIYCLVC